jgi:hypothetical protein
MDEHVRTTAIRKDEAKTLSLIEPLYSSRLSHRQSPVLAQFIREAAGRIDANDDLC